MARPLFRSPAAQARFNERYDAILARWPVPYETLDIPTAYGTTRVVACGPAGAPPLILLSCVNGTATVWGPNVEAWGRDHRVYAVDVMGQHNRSLPKRAIPNRAELAVWLGEVMDGLDVERASFVGNSYGGFVAMNQAILAPGRVEKAVLIGPAGTFVALPRAFPLVMGLPVMLGLWGLMQPRFAKALEGGITLDPDWLQLATSNHGPLDYISVGPIAFSTTELGGARAPTLLLIGDREILYKPQLAIDLARAKMPGLTAEIVPNANHVSAMSNPDWVNRRVLEFLAS